jgi:putative redox protein
MSSQTVRADWISDQLFLLRDRNDFPIVMTQPNGVNGADLLPLSLIGCAAWDIMSILHKQRQQVVALQVIADSEQDEASPWRFRRIHVRYRFSGRNLKARSIKRAIALSETKYCSIYATLRDAVEIRSEYEIIDEGGLPSRSD